MSFFLGFGVFPFNNIKLFVLYLPKFIVMKCFTAVVLMFSLFSSVAMAQNLTVGSAGKPLRAIAASTSQGSPYYRTEFAPSKVVVGNGKKLTLDALRYDLLNQHVEYLSKDVVYEVQDSLSSFEVVDTLGKLHVLEKLAADKEHRFFEILAPGKVSLLKRYTAKSETTEDWYTKKKSKSLVRTSAYYILKDDAIEKFNPSKKNILAVFNASSDQAKNYFDDKAADLKTDAGLSQIFNDLNR